jgi:hypothetical protein
LTAVTTVFALSLCFLFQVLHCSCPFLRVCGTARSIHASVSARFPACAIQMSPPSDIRRRPLPGRRDALKYNRKERGEKQAWGASSHSTRSMRGRRTKERGTTAGGARNREGRGASGRSGACGRRRNRRTRNLSSPRKSALSTGGFSALVCGFESLLTRRRGENRPE